MKSNIEIQIDKSLSKVWLMFYVLFGSRVGIYRGNTTNNLILFVFSFIVLFVSVFLIVKYIRKAKGLFKKLNETEKIHKLKNK